MKKIIIAYWSVTLKDLPYDYNEEFDYSIDMRNIIIEIVLSKGYQIMLIPTKDCLIIGIDNRRFRQR